MNRMLYVSMSGANQLMLAQAVNANNLANADTTGFQADMQSFKSMNVTGPGYATRAYAVDTGNSIDSRPGPMVHTGRALDVAVQGQGWIAVQGPSGQEAYTRAGHLNVGPNGLLTSNGHPVIGNGGPIAVPPYSKIEIGGDGTISVQPLGQGPQTLATVGRIKLVNPPASQITKGTDGLIHTRNGAPAPADANVRLTAGTLEGSNVNSIDAMVNMIDLARRYDMQVKMMKTAQNNNQSSTQLLKLA